MNAVNFISSLSIPAVLSIVALILLFGKRADFDSFISGARDGLSCAVSLLPSLCAVVVGIKMLSASGALEFLCELVLPAAEKLGVPGELLPLLMTRPFSGSASTASFAELMKNAGADSFPSFCAAIIMGSSDTLVYIISIYFSSVKIKKSRYAFPCALLTMLFCIFLSCITARIFYR